MSTTAPQRPGRLLTQDRDRPCLRVPRRERSQGGEHGHRGPPVAGFYGQWGGRAGVRARGGVTRRNGRSSGMRVGQYWDEYSAALHGADHGERPLGRRDRFGGHE